MNSSEIKEITVQITGPRVDKCYSKGKQFILTRDTLHGLVLEATNLNMEYGSGSHQLKDSTGVRYV